MAEHGPSSGRSLLVSTHHFQSPFDPCGDDGPPSPTTCHCEPILASQLPLATSSKPSATLAFNVRRRCIYLLSSTIVKRNSVAHLSNMDTRSRVVVSRKRYILYYTCSLSLLKSHLLDLRQTAVVLTPIRAEGLRVDQYSLPIANRL